MIELLTKEKLVKYCFTDEQVTRLLTWDNYEFFLLDNVVYYFVSNIEKRIYSGNDALRKYYFRDENTISLPYHNLNLIEEYFYLKQLFYLKKIKQKAGNTFIEKQAKERFLNDEIEITKKGIIDFDIKETKIKSATDRKERLIIYLDWLNYYSNTVNNNLSSLIKNNMLYDNYVKEYYNRIEVATNYLDKNYFIKSEIERVKNVCIQPSQMSVFIDGQIVNGYSYTPDKYTKYAFDWLSTGHDVNIEEIISNGLKEYREYKINAKHNYLNELESEIDTFIIKKSIYSSLQCGVAYVIYNKFLNEQLATKQIEYENKATKTDNAELEKRNTYESEQYIKPELLNRLNEVESKMNPIIGTFKQSKIKCSAWVELLMEKGYFEIAHKTTIRKSAIGFAKLRYGVDITTQMNTAKNKDRNSHKQQLSKYLK